MYRCSARVFLLDDHKLFLDGLKALLSQQEWIEVIGATTRADEALRFLSTEINVDLVVTDVSIPDMNGVEFIKKVRQLKPQIKILVLSMFEDMHGRDGIDGYLTKQANEEELLKAIRVIAMEGKTYFPLDMPRKGKYQFNKSILTKREIEITKCIVNELTSQEIADKLFISIRTVETHRKNIFLKLGVHNTVSLTKEAMRLGYVR